MLAALGFFVLEVKKMIGQERKFIREFLRRLFCVTQTAGHAKI
jgi:hypothetical protein